MSCVQCMNSGPAGKTHDVIDVIICLKSFKNALTFITVYCFAQSVVEVSCH